MLVVLSMRLWAMQIFRIEIYYRTVALVALCCFYANTLLFFFHAKRWKSSLLCIFKKRLTSTFSQQVLVVSFSSVYRVHFNVRCVLWAWVILCNSLKKNIYIYFKAGFLDADEWKIPTESDRDSPFSPRSESMSWTPVHNFSFALFRLPFKCLFVMEM